jgi:hypothetical protein
MMLKERMRQLLDIAGEKREHCLESPNLRTKETAFTRTRKLGAGHILDLVLSRISMALQLQLDKYFKGLREDPVSKQAFSKARDMLNPEYVREYADLSSEEFAQDNTMPCYKGMRLIAIDGTDIALENTQELKEHFGCSGPKKDAATALASIAYGPLDHVIYDCRIGRYDKDERDLALLHMERLKGLGLSGSLLLFDRWYPSAEFIDELYKGGFHFVMRVRRKWNLGVDNIKTQGRLFIPYNGKGNYVRVLKVRLSTGETETLLTSLNQKQLPIAEASELYFKRWGIETAYDTLKSKLELENFSGKKVNAVLQDFYATIFLANIAAGFSALATEQIETVDAGRETPLKHPRQASWNRTIYELREDFLRLLLEPNRVLGDMLFDRLVSDIARRPVSVVKNRIVPRKKPRKKRFHMRRKSVMH